MTLIATSTGTVFVTVGTAVGGYLLGQTRTTRERVAAEQRWQLLVARGQLEETVLPYGTPQSVITEGIAQLAMDIVIGEHGGVVAVAGDVAKTESRNPAIGNKESAVVGVSYSLKRFTGRVAVGARCLAAVRSAASPMIGGSVSATTTSGRSSRRPA